MKKLKPFDLKDALNGEPVMLRNGNKAFVRHHETEQEVGDDFRLWGVVTFGWGDGTVTSWTIQGEKAFANSASIAVQRGYDIIGMYPRTRIINGFEVPSPIENDVECVAMLPHLVNRGDGVDGHYCICRIHPNGYRETWNEKQEKWCSAGTVFKLGKAT